MSIGPRSIATIEPLLAGLEQAGLAPAIARNHERFPVFRYDLDLFVRGDRDRATPVFEAIARKLDWDSLTVCTHHAVHRRADRNIVAFRFHHLNPPETLLVDMFGGLSLLGCTLATADTLCETRVRDLSGRFFHIDGVFQNGYRLFQIESLMRAANPDREKIRRYRQRVLRFDEDHEDAIAAWARGHHLIGMEAALAALREGRDHRFGRLVRRAKRRFGARRFLCHPVDTLASARDRLIGLWREKYLDPCGPVLRLDSGRRDDWEQVLDRLVQACYLNGWATKCRAVRQCGGASVVFAADGEPFKGGGASFDLLARQLAGRHRMIYCRTGMLDGGASATPASAEPGSA